MTTNNRILAAALLASALYPVQGRATVMKAASFDEKVDAADSIIMGQCTKTSAQYDSTGRWILTYATFHVEQSLKGQPASEVTVVVPGGTVGGIHQGTIGVPTFEPGNERVLFIRGSRVGPTVLYADQGTYEVSTDEHGEKNVRPVASSAIHLDTQRGVIVPLEPVRSFRTFQSNLQHSLAHSSERMELIRRSAQPTPSIWSVIAANKLLIGLALLGAALASWRLFRR